MFCMFFLFKTTTNPTSFTKHDEEVKTRQSGEWDLEMNHTHYLMLDDGRLRHYNTDDFRTKLCVSMAKLEDESDLPRKSMKVI